MHLIVSFCTQKRGETRTDDSPLKGMPTPPEWLATPFLSAYRVDAQPHGDDIVDYYDTNVVVDGFP